MNIRRIIKEEIDNTPYLDDLDKDLAYDLWVSNGFPSENFDAGLDWTKRRRIIGRNKENGIFITLSD